jgi:hypothetical protein
MRGGRELVADDFKKREGEFSNSVKIRIDKKIGFEPYIFFGDINNASYQYAIVAPMIGDYISCFDHLCNEIDFDAQINMFSTHKMKSINSNRFLTDLNNLKTELKKEMYNGKFRRIKKYLNKFFEIIKNRNPDIFKKNEEENENGPANVRRNGTGSAYENEHGQAHGTETGPALVIENSSAHVRESSRTHVRENGPAQERGNRPSHENENERRKRNNKNRELIIEDFSKEHYIGEFTIKQIDGQNYFFIGHNNDNYTLVYYYTGDTPESLVILVLFKGTRKLVPVSRADYNRILSIISSKYNQKTSRGNLNIDPRTYQNNSKNYYLYAILQNFCNDLMGNTNWFNNNPMKLMNEISKKDNNELLKYHRKIRANKIAKSFMYIHSDNVQSKRYTETDFSKILSDQSITENFGLIYEINKKTGESLEDAILQCRLDLENALRDFYNYEKLYWLKEYKRGRRTIITGSPLSFYDVLEEYI